VAQAAPSTASPKASASPRAEEDQRIILHGVSWKTYVLMRELLDSPGLRVTYDGGALELMTLSRSHAGRQKLLARLLELWALVRTVRLYSFDARRRSAASSRTSATRSGRT
jgi:hypothetical protein